ncbi:hypothetical protein GCM10025331_42630 [Actinoplanes utahensis]|nr:hypothetical protein Aut01nite_02560 [Actinoplanes utahensis]
MEGKWRMPRMSVRRAAGLAAAAVTMVTGSMFVAPSSAMAGGCTGNVGCGSVNNNTRFKMTTTETWNSGPNKCAQWRGTTTTTYKCTQNDLAPGGLRGGNSVDVDAFTYNYNDFFWNNNKIKKGQWIRIPGGGNVYCKATLSETYPRCD